jgi:hypothetical protein
MFCSLVGSAEKLFQPSTNNFKYGTLHRQETISSLSEQKRENSPAEQASKKADGVSLET